jgi:hypothetical protein
MNEKDMNNDKLEQFLRRAHIPEPTPLLKERITAEARKALNQTSVEMSWQIPIRRLAASAAAAVLIISITNLFSDYTLQKWNFRDASIISRQIPDFEVLVETTYSPFVRYLASVDRKPSIHEATALRDYTERVLQVLNEMQQNGIPKKQVPEEGRSRLFQVQPGSDYYS